MAKRACPRVSGIDEHFFARKNSVVLESRIRCASYSVSCPIALSKLKLDTEGKSTTFE